MLYLAGHINHSIFWKNLTPVHVSLYSLALLSSHCFFPFHFFFKKLLLTSDLWMSGRRRWAPKGCPRLGYWHSFWFTGNTRAKDQLRRCCFTGLWMGGRFCSLWNSQHPFYVPGHWLVVPVDAHFLLVLYGSFHLSLPWQWLGLDKDLKKLVVETTANQVFWKDIQGEIHLTMIIPISSFSLIDPKL